DSALGHAARRHRDGGLVSRLLCRSLVGTRADPAADRILAQGYRGMIVVIGGRGRLAQAIARQYSDDTVICPERMVYQDWSAPGAQGAVAAWLAPFAGSGATIFVTSGLLDPRLAPEALSAVNVELPRNIIEGAAAHGLKVVTF